MLCLALMTTHSLEEPIRNYGAKLFEREDMSVSRIITAILTYATETLGEDNPDRVQRMLLAIASHCIKEARNVTLVYGDVVPRKETETDTAKVE
jgi:hypothetical protein